MKKTLILFSIIRLIPHIICLYFHKNKQIIKYDVERWLHLTGKNHNFLNGFIIFMTFYPEFRNLFYKRGWFNFFFFNWLAPKMNTLFIVTSNIGPGLFIQHGFATIIAAKSIGTNCWINQQVTIGYSNKSDNSIIGDNVTINAGAKVIGRVVMGNGSKAGANRVIVKDVPENCTVVGVPSYIISRNGVRIKEKL